MSCDAGYACDESDIDQMMADEIDAKGDELWEQGAREVLGDKEFERLYPELKRRRGLAIASGFDSDSDPELIENIERLNRQ